MRPARCLRDCLSLSNLVLSCLLQTDIPDRWHVDRQSPDGVKEHRQSPDGLNERTQRVFNHTTLSTLVPTLLKYHHMNLSIKLVMIIEVWYIISYLLSQPNPPEIIIIWHSLRSCINPFCRRHQNSPWSERRKKTPFNSSDNSQRCGKSSDVPTGSDAHIYYSYHKTGSNGGGFTGKLCKTVSLI